MNFIIGMALLSDKWKRWQWNQPTTFIKILEQNIGDYPNNINSLQDAQISY